ncbi:putative zinc-binding metallopeptidase [Alkanindiges sp. WGS2144]|uniref:zinc-binding metallopeptidase family protein n=1 Tax=Alkanindiges sp. WGS2144 TaxID=3366808 RepID=UPI003750CE9E
MKTFYCQHCGHQVFFLNTQCENCRALLGYLPDEENMGTFFEKRSDGLWQSQNPQHISKLFKPCYNYQVANVCNWMLPATSSEIYCKACQLTTVIPNLDEGNNKLYWSRLEAAKRRFLYSLYQLKIPPQPKRNSTDTEGLAFEFLAPYDNQPVMTGHDSGRITINIAEADSSYREWTRESMQELYRTLLGHFRHESGHYYFDRLIEGTKWYQPFKQLFGDDAQNYQGAINRHYDQGAPEDWQNFYVSSYASMHPWEDWAETWAHYLHMMDTLDTAYHSGINIQPYNRFEPHMYLHASPVANPNFDQTLADWFALSYALNSLNRSMGLPDAYPFALSQVVLDKLRFVHQVLLEKYRESSL